MVRRGAPQLRAGGAPDRDPARRTRTAGRARGSPPLDRGAGGAPVRAAPRRRGRRRSRGALPDHDPSPVLRGAPSPDDRATAGPPRGDGEDTPPAGARAPPTGTRPRVRRGSQG